MSAAAYRADIEAILPSFGYSKRVLELGCGSGIFTQFLVSQGLTVVGVDRNESQLTETRQRLPETTFLAGDFEATEFIEQVQSEHPPFDLIATRYVIHELSDPIETFRLWKHLLKPGGRLLLIENAWVRQDWGWSDWGKRSISIQDKAETIAGDGLRTSTPPEVKSGNGSGESITPRLTLGYRCVLNRVAMQVQYR